MPFLLIEFKHRLNDIFHFLFDALWFQDFELLPVPKQLLIEIVAGDYAILEDTPFLSGLNLLLRFMNRKGSHIIPACLRKRSAFSISKPTIVFLSSSFSAIIVLLRLVQHFDRKE